MITPDGIQILVYDIEVFPNFFLASFYDGTKKGWTQFREHQIHDLVSFLRNKDMVLAGYNNFGYDDVIMKWLCANADATTKDIYALSKSIITDGRGNNAIFRIQYSPAPWAYSLDVFQYFNKRGSLKEWECKEQLPRVVESPCDFDKPLPAAEIPKIIDYCRNDVQATYHLLKKNMHLVKVRHDLDEIYGLGNRVYVVGDAGVAQMVFMSLHSERSGEWITKTREKAAHNPDNKAREWAMTALVSKRVKYVSAPFKQMLREFLATSATGDKTGTKWSLDSVYKKSITLADREYQLGVGGLHTVDGPGVFRSTKTHAIIDLDVASYYPSLIIEEGLYPAHLGPAFVEDMRKLRDSRIEAKHGEKAAKARGDEAEQKRCKGINEALKIVINSTFGKLNDAYSPLRSIPDAMRVTVNGQLMLLMLIEKLGLAKMVILSANTDGVTIFMSRKSRVDLDRVKKEWETATGHELEEAEYSIYARRDVNAYLAMKTDGEVKRKGAFTPYPLTGKWDGIIVKEAAARYFSKGIDPAVTINDPTAKPEDFLYYQRVKNGGHIYLGTKIIGRIARWYVATEGPIMKRQDPNGKRSKVPHGESAALAMDVSSWKDFGVPEDLDRQHYITEAWRLINSSKEKADGTSAVADTDEEDQ